MLVRSDGVDNEIEFPFPLVSRLVEDHHCICHFISSHSMIITYFRMITLFEELVLLKEFEKRENVLMEKVAQKKQEKEEMQEKVNILQLNL